MALASSLLGPPAWRRRRGLANLTVITADLLDFQPPAPGTYERVVSIECFEHMKVRRGERERNEKNRGRDCQPQVCKRRVREAGLPAGARDGCGGVLLCCLARMQAKQHGSKYQGRFGSNSSACHAAGRVQNYKELFGRIAAWLAPRGLLFFHIFVHARGLPYHFEASGTAPRVPPRPACPVLCLWALPPGALAGQDPQAPALPTRPGHQPSRGPCPLASCDAQVQGEDDWMTKYFFSGGTMPSIELMHMFQDDLAAQQTW